MTDGSTSNNAKIQNYQHNGTDAQFWKITTDSDGYSTIINVKSGKALDVPGGTVANGKQLEQYTPNGSKAQKWKIIERSNAYKIVSAVDESYCIDLANGSTDNGAAIQLYQDNSTSAQRWTFTNITVKNYTAMPFYTDAQLAAQPKWTSSSTVTAVGGTVQCTSIWNNTNGKAWDFQKAGNGILIQNVGTDLDGDSYDIKIVANSVKGVHNNYGTVGIDIWGELGSKLSEGTPIWVSVSCMNQGEASMTFSYLKHGTSKAANVKATPTIYDIDSSNWGASCPDLLFNGYEGISLSGQTATCYVNSSSDMKIDKSAGTFRYSGDWGTAYSGKDIGGAVTPFFNSSSFTMTFTGFGSGIDIGFDVFKNPGSPSKSAKITE